MKKHRTHEWVYLGRSGIVERTVWTDGNRYFIKWSGECIEVTPSDSLAVQWKAMGDY